MEINREKGDEHLTDSIVNACILSAIQRERIFERKMMREDILWSTSAFSFGMTIANLWFLYCGGEGLAGISAQIGGAAMGLHLFFKRYFNDRKLRYFNDTIENQDISTIEN